MPTIVKLNSGETVAINNNQAWLIKNYGLVNEKVKSISVTKAKRLIEQVRGL